MWVEDAGVTPGEEGVWGPKSKQQGRKVRAGRRARGTCGFKL